MSKTRTWQKLAEEGNTDGQAGFGEQWDNVKGPMRRKVVTEEPKTFGQNVRMYGGSFMMGAFMGFTVGGSVGLLHCVMSNNMKAIKPTVLAAGLPFAVIFGVGQVMREAGGAQG